MPQLAAYSKDDLPRDLAVQVASYLRVQWPFLLKPNTPLWESTSYPDDGKHFVIFDRDVLIAHALAHHKTIEHAGRTWKVGALSSVFTYPTHRGSGFGEEVVSAATKFLRDGATDFALLFCGERVKSLYQRQGWEESPGLRCTFGDPQRPQKYDEEHLGGFVLVLYVSDAACAAREGIEAEPIHVGANTW